MSEAAKTHNEAVSRIVAELWRLAGGNVVQLNVMAESLLLGVAMFNFPSDPRRQSLIIQEIADGAQDRVKAVRA